MSGGPDNKNTMRFTGAAFLCAALVLLVLLLQPLINVIAASARPAPSPSPDAPSSVPRETYTVAFFGSAPDPFCAPLFPFLDDLAAANGWRLIRYDCRGNATNQGGQIEDFLRLETADLAVVYSVLEQEDLDEQVKALYETCPVVTVGNSVSFRSERYVTAHVGVYETERVRTLAEYFGENLRENSGILLISDVPDEIAEALYDRMLSKEKVAVLGQNYSWLGVVYTERYLNTWVTDFSDVGGVFCTSRYGTVGTANVLREKELRDEIKIAALTYEPAMAEDLVLGELDAAVAVSVKEAEEMLAEILPKVLKGEPIKKKSLTPILLTPENLDAVDLGY